MNDTLRPGSFARWNAGSAADAARELLTCCASPMWAGEVVRGRPYPDSAAAIQAGAQAIEGLTWAEVLRALAAHPRIGERLAAGPSWSRRDQAGAQGVDAATEAALVEVNRAYEERFGHVFLIFATGRTAGEMLTAARQRLRHDDETERRVVRGELAKITRLRMERLFSE